MIEQLRRHVLLVSVVGAALGLAGCGEEIAILEIANEHDETKGAITELRVGTCEEEELSPQNVTIEFGESYELELDPGCHVVSVTRDGSQATARVRLEAGDTAVWVPSRVDDVEEDDWKACDSCE